MKAFGRQDMRCDQVVQRAERYRAGAHLVGQGRQAEVDAFARIAVALPVQRLVLPILLEQDHGQQVRSRPSDTIATALAARPRPRWPSPWHRPPRLPPQSARSSARRCPIRPACPEANHNNRYAATPILSGESICRPSAGPRRTPGPNRVPPVDPFKQIAELSRADRHRFA